MPAEIFQERIAVEILNVDVVVTDKKGRPVEGLGRDDFELRVDGQEVPIANFYSVSATGTPMPALQAADEAAGDEDETSSPVEDPLQLVVYFDSFYLTPQSRKRVLRDMPVFLERQVAAGARVMLVQRAEAPRILTPFTTDLGELEAGLARVEEEPAGGLRQRAARSSVQRSIEDVYRKCEESAYLVPCVDCFEQMVELARLYSAEAIQERRSAMSALGALVNALSVLEGKKALLHVSDGIQQQTGVDVFFYIGDKLCPERRQDLQVYDTHQDVNDLNALVSRANASRVTLYTLEAAGLRNFSSASAENADFRFTPSPLNDQIRFANLQGTLYYISNETGGKAILNANQFAPDLEKLTSEFRTYYSLGYQPRHPGGGETHRVSVKVEKGGYQVRYRRSILHKKPEQQLADRALGAVMFNVTENPLAAQIRTGSPSPGSDGRLSVPIDIAVPVEKLTLVPQDGARLGRLSVVVAAPDEKGKETEIRKKDIDVHLPLESTGDAAEVYRFGVVVELAPGEYNLGIGIWDEVGATGSFLSLQVEARAESESSAEAAD